MPSKGYRLSPQHRENIRLGAIARWARTPPELRKLSPRGRARIAAANRRRWAAMTYVEKIAALLPSHESQWRNWRLKRGADG